MASSTTPAEDFWFKVYLIVSFFSLVFAIHDFVTDNPHTSRCGIVTKKIIPQDVDINKSIATVNYNEYFVVHFESGSYEKVKIDTNTFYSKKEGDRVCFDVPPSYSGLYIAFAIISYFLLVINIILLIAFGISQFNEYLNK